MVKDRLEKMKSSLSGKIKPSGKRDDLFQTTATTIGEGAQAKMELFTERVTLALTPQQKDFLDSLGKQFQRKRTVKLEAINRNSIIRGLVDVLQEIKFSETDTPSNEKELKEVLKQKLLGK